MQAIILFLAFVFSTVESKLHKKKNKLMNRRPYGYTSKEDEAGIIKKLKTNEYNICPKIPYCNMCAETFTCGNFFNKSMGS